MISSACTWYTSVTAAFRKEENKFKFWAVCSSITFAQCFKFFLSLLRKFIVLVFLALKDIAPAWQLHILLVNFLYGVLITSFYLFSFMFDCFKFCIVWWYFLTHLNIKTAIQFCGHLSSVCLVVIVSSNHWPLCLLR